MRKQIQLDNPKHKEFLAQYFGQVETTIIDPSKKFRAAIKKVLLDLGQPPKNIHFVDNLKDAKTCINLNQADYLFTTYKIPSGDEENPEEVICDQLISPHREHYPDIKRSAFYIVTPDKFIHYTSSLYLSHHLDDYFDTPLSSATLQSAILSSLSRKLLSTKYESQIDLGRKLFNLGQFSSSIDIFKNALPLIPNPSEAHAWIGKAYDGLEQEAKAVEHYQKALYFQKDNYTSLVRILDYHIEKQNWEEATDYLERIQVNYPFAPDLVAKMMVVLLRTQKYEQIYELAMNFSRLEAKDLKIQQHVAAGLVMSGRHFSKRSQVNPIERETAKKILLKAAELSQAKVEVIKNVCLGLLEADFFDEGYNLLGEYMEKASSREQENRLKAMELEFLFKARRFTHAMKMGLDLMKKAGQSFDIYDYSLRSAIELKRGISTIEDIAEMACKAFPDKSSYFLHQVESYKAKKD